MLWLLVMLQVCLVLLLLRPFRNVLAVSPTSPSAHSPHNLPPPHTKRRAAPLCLNLRVPCCVPICLLSCTRGYVHF